MPPEWMTQLQLRWKALWRRRQLDRDLEDEIRFHLAMRAEKNAAQGMPDAEARAAARRAFGNPALLKETCRGLWTFASVENLWRDLRYAARILRKSPGFTLVAVATLALGIGANTAVFSVVDAVLLRPLPYPEPERLGAVVFEYKGPEYEGISISQDGRTWEAIRDRAADFDCAVFSGWPTKINLAAPHHVEYVVQQRVSAGFFRVMGVAPLFGREFTKDEDRATGPPVAVLSYELWQRAFAGDRSVLGHPVSLRGEPYTIVGIMPPAFRTSTLADVWTPLKPSTSGEGGGTNYGIAVRLASGATWATVQSRIANIGAERIKTMKLSKGASARLKVVPLQRALAKETQTPVLILWTAVALVLLIGCVNIAGLLMARSAGRTREIATRLALGGGRTAVLRQLLAESLLLSAMGGAAGLAVGFAATEQLKLLARDSLHLWQTVGLDARVLLATTGLSLLTSLLFGLYPAWQASRMDIRTALVEGGARGVAGMRNQWPRRILVIGEVALGFVLLIGAGLMIRTFL
jgi:predicted permease